MLLRRFFIHFLGPLSTFVENVLDTSVFIYNLRKLYLASNYTELSDKLSKCYRYVSTQQTFELTNNVPIMLRSNDSNQASDSGTHPNVVPLLQELKNLLEHSENKKIISQLTALVGNSSTANSGSISTIRSPIGEMDVSLISTTVLKECLHQHETNFSTKGGKEAQLLTAGCVQLIELRELLYHQKYSAVIDMCVSTSATAAFEKYVTIVPIMEEVERAVEESEDQVLCQLCHEALIRKEDQPEGKVGQLNVLNVNTKLIDNVIRKGQAWNCTSDRSSRYMLSCEYIRRLRTCLTMSDWIGVEHVLQECLSKMKESQRSNQSSSNDSPLVNCCLFELELIRLEMYNSKMVSSSIATL